MPQKIAPKLTIKEAWQTLADWWDSTVVCGCGCGRPMGAPAAVGLCACISLLSHREQITYQQEQEMLDALPRRGPVFIKGVRPFQWPTTKAGAIMRRDFCIDQAEGR